MRIALPLKEGQFCPHFGKSDGFRIVDVDPVSENIASAQSVSVDRGSSCRSLPEWLAGQGIKLVIAGGMGGGAVNGLSSRGIDIVAGALPAEPDQMVRDYLAGRLQCGDNACQGHDHDHDHDHDHGHHHH